MKVLRSSFVAAVAFVAAACGDKVTVAGPASTTVTPNVTAVAVAPATATMSVGQTVSFTSVVTSVGGAATTVTWNSTDATRVSVSATGVATAVAATPGVAICATSTVNTNAKGCASVAVSAVPITTTIPASVSIASITSGNPGAGLNTPVNPLAVFGQIDVRVNVNPGTQTISRIVLVIGGVRADSQTFTAAASASMRYAADLAVETQATFPQILFSVNTAAITSNTTGAVRWLNGPQLVSVQLFTVGSAASTASATAQTSLTFANVDGWLATVTGSLQNAINAGGFRYDRGPITVAAVPVSYTGGAMTSGTVSFGSAACDGSLTGARTTALVAPATGTSAWTATLSNTGTAAAGNVNGYQFNGCAGANAIGELVTVVAVNAAGDALFAGAAPLNATAVVGIRLDNLAPASPVINGISAAAMPNGRNFAWVNDAVTFNGLATSTAALPVAGAISNGFICDNQTAALVGNCAALVAAPADLGVGGVVFAMSVAASTSPTTTAAAAALTNATTLAAATTNTTYCAVAHATDAVGNRSILLTAGNAAVVAGGATAPTCAQLANGGAGGGGYAAQGNVIRFGVDRDAPTIAWDASSLAASARINTATLAGEFVVTVADLGAVGNSGMAPLAAGTTSGPVLMNLRRRRADGDTRRDAAGTTLSGSTALVNTGVVYAAPLGSSAVTALSTAGTSGAYWTASVLAQDAAGNRSATLTRTVAGDATGAIVAAASVPASITGSFSASAFLGDNLDLRDYYTTAAYAGGGLAYLAPTTFTTAAAPTVVNGFDATPLLNTNVAVTATINMPLILQATTAGNAPVAYAAVAANAITGISIFARDQTQAAYGTAASAIAFASLSAPTTGISLAGGFATMVPASNAAATLCGATGLAGGCVVGVTVGAVATANLSVAITGTTAVFNNPFAGGVDFYGMNGVDLVLLGNVAASALTLVDNGATRVFTYTLAVNGSSLFTQLGGTVANITRSIFAVGRNSAGTVGMVTQPLAQTINY